ncbi:hypothetical protein [Devosia submarina]|uniref:hypothetical protein n=1 Tax=Devosia submarina TaxID=1173082 RepID=UPI00130083E1|nr:hypothetical protein [Devosia submarina]
MNFMDSSDQRHTAPTCCYIVVEITGTWWIDIEGKPFGPCEDREDAITCAFKLIEMFGDRTRPAAVYAPDENGRTRLIWKGQLEEDA